MVDFKAYATRAIREAGLMESDRTVWARHGSTRSLRDEGAVRRAIQYVEDGQGIALKEWDPRWDNPRDLV